MRVEELRVLKRSSFGLVLSNENVGVSVIIVSNSVISGRDGGETTVANFFGKGL